MRHCTLSEALDPPALEAAIDGSEQLTLLHTLGLRCPRAAAADPAAAVHTNLLLTRQLLQSAIAAEPDVLVLLSSIWAEDPSSLLGASLAAAELSLLEAAPHLSDCRLAVLRLPHAFDQQAPTAAEHGRRLEASRAALDALAAHPVGAEPLLLHWPADLDAPQHLQATALQAVLPPPGEPLLGWLQRLSSPLQRRDQDAVADALLTLFASANAHQQPCPQNSAQPSTAESGSADHR